MSGGVARAVHAPPVPMSGGGTHAGHHPAGAVSGGHDRPAVSVVVPALNEAATIAAALAPLLAEPVPGGIEVIVAVGPSHDGTRAAVEALARDDARVRIVDNPGRVTPLGLNAAIRASRGQVILRMDGHAVPAPGYVGACLAALAESGAWNVGGRLRKGGRTAVARAAAAATTSAFGIGGGQRFHLVTRATIVDTVWPGCWPRWVFERIGLFDPEMVRNQDDEFNQRIADAGGRVWFDPSIVAEYESRATWRGLFRQYFGYGMYKVRGLQKRPRLLRARHLVPAAFIGSIAGALALAVVRPRPGLAGLAAIGLAWAVGAGIAAKPVARSHGTDVASVTAAYACIHGGYGLGMWAGLVRFAHRWVANRHGSVPVLEPLPAPETGSASSATSMGPTS